MSSRVLYLGDTSLDTAAGYLAGLMTRWELPFTYVGSDTPLSSQQLDQPLAMVIVSDYPAARIDENVQQSILSRVAAGAGLLMCGGWESFQGSGGGWSATPLAAALPVHIAAEDDRVNCDHAVYAVPVGEHPATANLPWEERPPLIGGFNRVQPRSSSDVVLQAQHIHARNNGDVFEFTAGDVTPLLVTGSYGAGRTAAFATDVAPHWIGPMVDWGEVRVTAQADGGGEIEVGSAYAQFLHQLLCWVGKITPTA